MREIIFVFLFAIICCKVLARNGGRSIGGRIVGGSEIEIEAIPYQVSVRFYESHICGGSILSARFVITAAHCTHPFPKIGFSVRAGSTNKDQGGSVHTVSKITEHPRFDDMLLDYDASILTLLNHIAFDKFRQPIKLPYFGEITKLGSIVATSGWGLTMNQNETNINLRIAELKISGQAECHQAYIADGGITSRMMCAYSSGRDSCSGGNLKYFH
jgi:trypsin